VQILMQKHPLALSRGELINRLERCGEEVALERSARVRPQVGERGGPVRGLVGERDEGAVGGLPQPGQQLDKHVERRVLVEFEQGRPRLAQLEQQRVPVGVVGEETHGSVAVPMRERRRLVLGLPVRVLKFEHDGLSVRRCRAEGERGRSIREGVTDR
jgi:hypothetical protein